MSYQKKVLVLSQIKDGFSLSDKRVGGIARIEAENNISTLYLSTINLIANGYCGFISHGKKTADFNLSQNANSAVITLEDSSFLQSFSIGVYKELSNDVILIAYASDEQNVNANDFKKLIMAEKKKKRPDIPLPLMPDKAPLPNIDNPFFPSTPEHPNNPAGSPQIRPPNSYDDEAVATENYYENDADFMKKLKIIEGLDKNVCSENDLSDCGSEKETQENEQTNYGFQNEKTSGEGKEYGEASPYFLTVKKELADIFDKFPPEECLTKSIPFSKWAKITYSENKYYVVGLVYEDNKEKYICYGVPAVFGEEPPKQLKGFCSFVPLSLFDLKGKGYWMMFQSAITGENIK